MFYLIFQMNLFENVKENVLFLGEGNFSFSANVVRNEEMHFYLDLIFITEAYIVNFGLGRGTGCQID